MKEIVIGNNEVEKRLDSFLKSYLPNASAGFIYKMLRKKNITLNGKKADGKEKLLKGDKIAIFFADETLDKFRGSGSNTKESSKIASTSEYKTAYEKIGNLQVVFENDHVLFVNKPAGILTQKAQTGDLSLNEWLIGYMLSKGQISQEELETYKPSVCNRLDRNTSGLVICAKSLKGARVMNKMLKDRTLDKYYRTIVSGHIQEGSKLKGFLYKDETQNKVIIKKDDPGDNKYSYIETEYIPLKYLKNQDLTYLEVKLITGKPHQIRAHLQSQNTPIIGDRKYGGRSGYGLKFQLLHSYRLIFPDKMDAELSDLSGREFIAELPDIYGRILEKG
nr:RluA family pseudouridine synthase [uncultured Butyrivibrio sp.]